MARLLCHYCKRGLLDSKRARMNCNALAATRDHIEPLSLGGIKTVWCCLQCNHLKGDLPLATWERFMARYPEWWIWFHRHGQVKTALHNIRMKAAKARFKFPFHVARPPLCRGLHG